MSEFDKTDSCREPVRQHGPSLPAAAYRKLGDLVAAFAANLSTDHEFAQFIQRDAKGFRSDLVRLVRLSFPLKHGRPRDQWLDSVCHRMEKGNSAADVLRSELPGFEALDTDTRLGLCRVVYQAAKRRKK